VDHHSAWLVCDEASNGKEAVERFHQARHVLIVLDFQMPEMNGLDAARHIVDLSPKTPILMVTIHLSKQLSEEARKVGIRGACAKTDISSVVDAVGALLREETYFPNRAAMNSSVNSFVSFQERSATEIKASGVLDWFCQADLHVRARAFRHPTSPQLKRLGIENFVRQEFHI
jgi:DNA-binding NarL/FixJ family response regulator